MPRVLNSKKIPSALAKTKGVHVCVGSTVLYLVFVVVLGATVERKVLLTDYMITEKVSALGTYVAEARRLDFELT